MKTGIQMSDVGSCSLRQVKNIIIEVPPLYSAAPGPDSHPGKWGRVRVEGIPVRGKCIAARARSPAFRGRALMLPPWMKEQCSSGECLGAGSARVSGTMDVSPWDGI